MNMYSKNKNKYILIILGVIIVSSLFFISNNIKKYYYSMMQRESNTISTSYLNNLELAIDANEITNQFLNERIISTAEVMNSANQEYSNERLVEMATALNVDHIYLYNKEGKIINSNITYMIDWTPPINHPAYNFIHGEESTLIEEIRASSVSGTYFKYGYVRLEDGNVLQVGILADKIYSFLSNFDIQNLMGKIKLEGELLDASFINIENRIVGSSNQELLGLDMTAQIENNNTNYNMTGITDYHGEKSYNVIVPVFDKSQQIGQLWLVHSMQKTNSIITYAIYFITIALLIIFIILWRFISQSEKTNLAFKKMIYYDELTGLKNYVYLKEYISDELSRKTNKSTALIMININKFKDINMTYGYDYGDRILRHIAKKLDNESSDNLIIFRFNSDRFIVLVDDYSIKQDLHVIVNDIVRKLDTEFTLQGFKKNLTLNLGIIESIQKYQNVDEIIRDATISLSYINESSNNRFMYFDEIMVDKIKREEIIETDLINALVEHNNDNLYIVAQPQVCIKSGKVYGFEVLTRLNSNTLGNVSPIEFIEIAEKRKLIVPLGEWILKESFVFLNRMETNGHKNLKFSINISGLQLLHQDFKSMLLNQIKLFKINPKNVQLEITESIILKEFYNVNIVLNELRKIGITIAVDDFGTGYSSLSRLNQINVDTVKIDKCFIDRISHEDDSEILTGVIISMSQKLGLDVIAEGIETKLQEKYLIDNNCDLLQGNLYSKPLKYLDALEFLNQNHNFFN